MLFQSHSAICALANTPLHGTHLRIRSILDALQLEHTQLQWKVSDRRKRGILGPSSIDRERLYPTVYNTVVDTAGINLDNSLAQADEQIKRLRRWLDQHAYIDQDGVRISCHCETSGFSGLLRDLDKNFPSQNSVLAEIANIHCLKIAKAMKEMGSQINDITRSRSPYSHIYTAAYYAKFSSAENDRPLPAFYGMTKDDHRRIYRSYRLQSLQEQGRNLFDISKEIVFILEYSHDIKSEVNEGHYFIKKSTPRFLVVAEKFERSLRQCNKYPHSIVAASGLIKDAFLSVRLLSGALTLSARDESNVMFDKAFQESMDHWDDSLKFFDEYHRQYSTRKKDSVVLGDAEDISSTVTPFHPRARIFGHRKDSEDSKNFCERESITLANVGMKITQAYPEKIMFDGHPEDQDVTDKRGSCGRIYMIRLPIPRTFTVDIDTAGEEKTTTFVCEKVAVKKVLLSPGLSDVRACARILRELETRVVLRHESILPLIGLWSNFDDGDLNYPLLMSPWMGDGDLHHFMNYHPETSVLKRLIFLRDIASALAYMHEYHNIVFVHGDLKADNVLVHEGRAYLHDFGTTRICGEDEGLRTRNPLGSWRWQAPELLDRFRDVPSCEIYPTPQSDMYAYGSLFLETMSGERPWDVPDALEYRIQHRSEIQKRPSSITDDRHWELMKHCWMEEPTLRQIAQEALAMVQGWVDNLDLQQEGG